MNDKAVQNSTDVCALACSPAILLLCHGLWACYWNKAID